MAAREQALAAALQRAQAATAAGLVREATANATLQQLQAVIGQLQSAMGNEIKLREAAELRSAQLVEEAEQLRAQLAASREGGWCALKLCMHMSNAVSVLMHAHDRRPL